MRLSGRVFRILIVALIALSLSWPSFVVTSEAAAGMDTMYYEADKADGKHVYHNSGVLYDGGIWEYTIDITDANPELYVLNDLGQTYTSLNPDIVEISETFKEDDDPTLKARLDIKKKGTATIQVDVPAHGKYGACTMYCNLKVIGGRRVRFMKTVADSYGQVYDTLGVYVLTDNETDKSSFSFMMSDTKPGIRVYGYDAEYSSMTEDLVSIDQDGWLTLKGTGVALIKAVVPSDGKNEEETFYCQFQIGKLYGISMNYTSSYRKDISEGGLQLDIEHRPGIELTYRSADENIASVDETGYVTFKGPGTVKIYADFSGNRYYEGGTVAVTINITGGSQNQNQVSNGSSDLSSLSQLGSSQAGMLQSQSISQVTAAAQAAPQTAAPAAAPEISKPKLKCSKRKKRSNKLTWSMVAGATGYELYIKYPGSKKYVKALTKSASVKSVTHKGLTRRKKYSYKVRAFAEIDGVKYYGPFSKAIKVKAK